MGCLMRISFNRTICGQNRHLHAYYIQGYGRQGTCFRRSWRNSHFAEKFRNIKINLFLGAIPKLNYEQIKVFILLVQ